MCNEGDYTEGVTLMFIEDDETFAYEPLAIDRGSVRTVDDNGFVYRLHRITEKRSPDGSR